jgi:hypothetical protein
MRIRNAQPSEDEERKAKLTQLSHFIEDVGNRARQHVVL